MNQGIAEVWEKLNGAFGSRQSPILRKPSRSVSPDLILSKRPLRPQKSWSKPLKKSKSPSISQSQNNSLLQDYSRLHIDLPSTHRASPISRPSTAPIRSSHRVIKSPVPCFLEGITPVDVQLIYKARCDDAHIPLIPEQLRRFYSFCSRNVQRRKFEMQSCSLGPASACVISQLLRNNFSFAQLDLGRNILTDKGAIQLVKSLAKSINLVHLGLSSNDISPDGAAAICRILTSHQSIVSLDLSSSEGLHRNRLADKGCEQVAVLLRENPVLTHLNLAGTAVGAEGLVHLTNGLRGNRSLLTLNIANNGLVGKTIEAFARVISSTRLKVLNLAENRLGVAGCDSISRMFQGYCPLHSIDLSKNEITQAGAAKVYSALARNSMLKTLVLDSNPLGPSANVEILNLFIDNRTLTVLSLAYCDLRAEGLAHFSDGLIRNHYLQHLNLAWNSLEDGGALALSPGLARNDSLKSVDLSSNRIKDTGGSAICESLRTNSTLEVLILQDNNLHDSVGQLLVDATRVNRSLLKVSLKLNPINQKYLSDISENLAANRLSQKRSVMPQLQSEIKRLQVRDETFTELEAQERQKKTEEAVLKRQLQETERKYDQCREEEERKFEAVRVGLEDVKRQRVEVAQAFVALEEEIAVSTTQKEKQRGEKAALEWETRLHAVTNEMHKMTKDCRD